MAATTADKRRFVQNACAAEEEEEEEEKHSLQQNRIAGPLRWLSSHRSCCYCCKRTRAEAKRRANMQEPRLLDSICRSIP
mmetsp:Transcript_65989/g.137804  ORF Transcript_65989/g.137804 Transcript_65989/m.137804 type:complete len:80 (-) Transcript_65989:174-413(-)